MKRTTQYERALNVLRLAPGAGWVHTRDLYRTGCVWHSRLAVLRKRGWVIERRQDGADHYYRLVAEPDTTTALVEENEAERLTA